MSAANGWTAIIPFKPAGARKTRLAGRLTAAQRDGLSEAMFNHVARTLAATPELGRVVLLSSIRPPGWAGEWLPDAGRGLNAELHHAAQALGAANLLIIHADLPFLTPADVSALIAAAADGCAIAPDRHGTGTNALALRDAAGFTFAFGAGSLQRHGAMAKARARILARPGLSLDIDTQADLDLAISQGLPVQLTPPGLGSFL